MEIRTSHLVGAVVLSNGDSTVIRIRLLNVKLITMISQLDHSLPTVETRRR